MEGIRRILVVEDDEQYAKHVRRSLLSLAPEVAIVHDVRSALKLLSSESFDVVVIDRGLPDGNGLDLCRWLRLNRPEAIGFVLTAHQSDADVEGALTAGADDFIPKTCGLDDLTRIIRTGVIRTRVQRGPLVGPLFLDRRRGVAELNGRDVGLAPMEFRMLLYLADAAGRSVSKGELHERVWGTHHHDSNTVVVHVRRTRAKLGEAGRHLLKTAPGGYCLRAEHEAARLTHASKNPP